MARVYGSRVLVWKGDKLYLAGKGPVLVSIVPDKTYPNMWRVKYSDGRLSDMVNRTRAKDAAQSIALGILNQRLVV